MFDKEDYVERFVKAAVAEDTDKMKELAEQVVDLSFDLRTELLSDIVDKLKKEDANEEIVAGLAATAQMMQVAAAAKAQEDTPDSTSAESKEHVGSKLEEVTEDVAADTGADESSDDTGADNAEVTTEAKSEGEAPAEEEKAEKPEDK